MSMPSKNNGSLLIPLVEVILKGSLDVRVGVFDGSLAFPPCVTLEHTIGCLSIIRGIYPCHPMEAACLRGETLLDLIFESVGLKKQ